MLVFPYFMYFFYHQFLTVSSFIFFSFDKIFRCLCFEIFSLLFESELIYMELKAVIFTYLLSRISSEENFY